MDDSDVERVQRNDLLLWEFDRSRASSLWHISVPKALESVRFLLMLPGKRAGSALTSNQPY